MLRKTFNLASRNFRLGALCAILILGLFGAGCQTPQIVVVGDSRAPSAVVLEAGDVVRVAFPGSPELDASQKIRADGKLSLPLIGEVKAAGKELDQLQKELKIRYVPQIKNTEVVVSLESTASTVYVSGAVNKPGKYPLDRPLTVLEAVMEAGGFTRGANPHQVTLIRQENGQYRPQSIDLGSSLQNNIPSQATYVHPSDVIYVRESIF